MKSTSHNLLLIALLSLFTLLGCNTASDVVRPKTYDELLTGWWQYEDIKIVKTADNSLVKQLYARGKPNLPYLNYDNLFFNFRRDPKFPSSYTDSNNTKDLLWNWKKNNTVLELGSPNFYVHEVNVISLNETTFQFEGTEFYESQRVRFYGDAPYVNSKQSVIFTLKLINK